MLKLLKKKKSRFMSFREFESNNPFLKEIEKEISEVFSHLNEKAINDEVYRKEVRERLISLSLLIMSDALIGIREFTWNRIQDKSEVDFDKRGLLLDAINVVSDASHSIPGGLNKLLENEWNAFFVKGCLPRAVYTHVAISYWLEGIYFGQLRHTITFYQDILTELNSIKAN